MASTLLLQGGAPSQAAACQCIERSLDWSRARATVIFEGELLRTEPAAGHPDGYVWAVLSVRQVWKGNVGQTARVLTTMPSMCPPHLAVGRRYILYASGTANALEVEGCSRWAEGDGLAAERRALGTPTRRAPANP